ncbi:cytosine permease [Yinghuangia aomiensis]
MALDALFAELGWHGGGYARAVALAGTLAMTFAVAMWGHATVQAAERWIRVHPRRRLRDPHSCWSCPTPTPRRLRRHHLPAWTLALVVMIAGPVSYLPMPSDYTRYLPRTTTLRSITWWGAIGGMVSSVLLGVVGVAAATEADMTDRRRGASPTCCPAGSKACSCSSWSAARSPARSSRSTRRA